MAPDKRWSVALIAIVVCGLGVALFGQAAWNAWSPTDPQDLLAKVAPVVGSGLAALLGLLVGAAITYVVQTKLEARKLRESERHLAYALLVQVTAAATRFKGMTATTAAAVPIVEPRMPQGQDFDQADFVCALLAELIRSDDKMADALRGMDPLMESMTDYLTTTLSGLSIGGRDLALLPKAVIAAHQRAATATNVVVKAVDAIVTTMRTDRSLLRDDVLRLTWTEMKKMGEALEALQAELCKVADVTSADVRELSQAASAAMSSEVAETTRRAKAMPEAAIAVKRFLEEKAAESSMQS